MQKKRFIINVFTITSSMIVIRIAGMISNIYISAKAGANAMGIYHMIFSVFIFGITFSSSGAGFAATILISQNKSDEKNIISKCLLISTTMSIVGFCVFFWGGSMFEKLFIRQSGTAKALQLLAFALPCMATSSVYRGYFIAKRKAVVITVSSLLEEFVCIFATLFLLGKYAGSPDSYMCLIWGCSLSNFSAFIFDSLIYKVCSSKATRLVPEVKLKNVLSICVPIALGSYLRTGLVSVENLLIPTQFAKYGIEDPVSEYGIIKAMALSVIMFPTVFIQSFSSMLVPEMSEMNASGRKNGIRYVSNLSVKTVMMFSFYIALMLFCHHDAISRMLFKEAKVSYYLGMLSLLAIPMYLDTVADSMLKGLGLQNACLKYNIIDSALRVIAMVLFMPGYGPVFYIAMLYISEIFNLSLSLGKASKITGLKINWFDCIILPVACFTLAYFFKSPFLQSLIYIMSYLTISKLKKSS